MYTGIVAGKVPIVSIDEGDGIRSFAIDLTGFEDDLEIGASVALDGVCTVSYTHLTLPTIYSV